MRRDRQNRLLRRYSRQTPLTGYNIYSRDHSKIWFGSHVSYFHDPIAIRSFHAFRKGILVSASAGNSGGHATVSNVAPSILTVGASSIDRMFNTFSHLGNKQYLRGTSLNPKGLSSKAEHGVVAGKIAAAHGVPVDNARYCNNNTLSHELVSRKIVVCVVEADRSHNGLEKAMAVKATGGLGMILIDSLYHDIASEYSIPTIVIGSEEATVLYKYLASESGKHLLDKNNYRQDKGSRNRHLLFQGTQSHYSRYH